MPTYTYELYSATLNISYLNKSTGETRDIRLHRLFFTAAVELMLAHGVKELLITYTARSERANAEVKADLARRMIPTARVQTRRV